MGCFNFGMSFPECTVVKMVASFYRGSHWVELRFVYGVACYICSMSFFILSNKRVSALSDEIMYI